MFQGFLARIVGSYDYIFDRWHICSDINVTVIFSLHIVLFSFLIKRTCKVNIHTFFKSSSLLFSSFGLRDKLYPGGERGESNIHHRQTAKKNKIITSRFSKLKCDLHGKYQAPLEPLFAILYLKKCKEKARTKTKLNIASYF